jgi:hypothetical protein
MKLGLNTYDIIGAFDSLLGHHYLAMCNKSRSRFMPIMLTFPQKCALSDYGETGSIAHLGIYSSIIEMWKGMDCKLSAIVMKNYTMADGTPGVEADMVLVQVGEDGMHVLHSDFPIADAALLSIFTKVPVFVGDDTSEAATIDMNFQGLDDAKIMETIIFEVDRCEKTLSEEGSSDHQNLTGLDPTLN